MADKNQNMPVSIIKGQANSYIYSILHDINKLKILLVFVNKGFTWHRELKSFGIYNNIIEQTLNEFNNLGLIDLRELLELDEIQYEAIKTVKQDIQHYFKIYFINNRVFDIIKHYQEDINIIMHRNPQLIEFMHFIRSKLEPFNRQSQKILNEENTMLTRSITLNGITFEKDTLLSKKVKNILKLNYSKHNNNLVLINDTNKSISLMNITEKRKYLNKVFYNNQVYSHNILNEIESKEKENNDFMINNLSRDENNNIIDGYIGKSELLLEEDRKKNRKELFNLLGIE